MLAAVSGVCLVALGMCTALSLSELWRLRAVGQRADI